MLKLLAKKVGMTQVFDVSGVLVPVTILRVEANVVVAKKRQEKNGYSAVVFGLDDMKSGKMGKSYAEGSVDGIVPRKILREVQDFDRECKIGDVFGAEVFEGISYVDVTGVSKGKGFQGVVRRWGFGGGRATHGSKFHREPGGTGQSTYPGKTFKNVKLPGRMGHEQVTILNLRVIKVDVENQILLVRGAVPGVKKGVVLMRPSVKKQRA